MRRRLSLGFVLLSSMVVMLSGVNVMATSITDNEVATKEEENKDTETNIGISRRSSEDMFESSDSEIIKQLSLEEEYQSNEEAILAIYKEQKEEEERIRKYVQKQNSIAWLRDYGINTDELSDTRIDVLNEAKRHLGTPYVWGGMSPSGFDCSGFTRYVFKQTTGIDIGRTTSSQPSSSYLKKISAGEAKPGDLVFRIGQHAGIYLKDLGSHILIIHSPQTGDRVKIGKYSKNVTYYRPTVYN